MSPLPLHHGLSRIFMKQLEPLSNQPFVKRIHFSSITRVWGSIAISFSRETKHQLRIQSSKKFCFPNKLTAGQSHQCCFFCGSSRSLFFLIYFPAKYWYKLRKAMFISKHPLPNPLFFWWSLSRRSGDLLYLILGGALLFLNLTWGNDPI